MVSDSFLSQAELDALLKGQTSGEDVAVDKPSTDGTTEDNALTGEQYDAIGEIGNISMGAAATALSKIVNRRVEITTPKVSQVDKDMLRSTEPRLRVVVRVEYVNGLTGINVLLLKTSDAAVIGDLMMGGDGTNASAEMDDVRLSAVAEAMNQMMGATATSLASILKQRVNISPPVTKLVDISGDDGREALDGALGENVVSVAFRITVENLIDSEFLQLIPIDFARELINGVYKNSVGGQESAAAPAEPQAKPVRVQDSAPVAPPSQSTSAGATMIPGSGLHGSAAVVRPAQFIPVGGPRQEAPAPQSLGLLMDVPLQVTVELGRAKLMIKDILELGKGSLVELERLAGEPVDVLVNGKLIAKGEVVVVDENFGVKIVDIISPVERVNGLQ